MFEVILDSFIDIVKLLPFLFLTYLLLEYLEHKTGDKTQKLVKGAGKFGPIVGGIAGMLPQCGFSTAASNFYAGRVITMGTLISIYLSTSDEMLPVLISEHASIALIGKILLAKGVIGMVAGILIDLIFKRKDEHEHIHELCEHDHCHCEKGIFRSALQHTLHIIVFIFAITLVLNLLIYYIGEDAIANLLLNKFILGPIIAGIVGLIPNCAASVVITQLYLRGAISVGSMMSGLLVGAGVGLLVLFKVNSDKKDNLKIVSLLYAIGVISGILIDVIV